MSPGASSDGDRDGGDEIAALVERAFHFRGDVTVRTAAGADVTGYLYNRDAGAGARWAQLFETGTGRDVRILYGDIRDVLFTGRDTAAPKPVADVPGPAGGDQPAVAPERATPTR